MTQFRVIDTETTGANSTPPDVACELASVDYDSESGQLMAPRSELIHIGIPMPPDAQGVHHISDAELAKARDISQVFKAIVSPFPYPEPIVLVAHNCEYEQRVLAERLDAKVPWVCTLKAAYRLWPDAPNHKNQTLRYFLKLEIPGKLAGGLPHRALPDAIVTALILKECLKLTTLANLLQWTKEPRLLPTCPIGKKQGWAGKKWGDVDIGFLQWMLDQQEMESDLKWNARHELDRRQSVRNTEGRDSYMTLIPGVIKMAKTILDLRNWFAGEKATRESLGILDGTEEFATIVRLCGEHKATLAPAAPPVAPAPEHPPEHPPEEQPEPPDEPDAVDEPDTHEGLAA